MTIGLVEFLGCVQIDRQTVEIWVEEEWIVPQGSVNAPEFSEVDVARARLILDLTNDLGVNMEGVGVALHLIDQVHDLRHAIADLARRSDAPDIPDNASA